MDQGLPVLSHVHHSRRESLSPHNLLLRPSIQLSKAQAALARWQALPPGAAERPRLAATVADEARSLAWQTDEVEKAVKAAARDPARFSLSPPELAARRAWVAATRSAVAALADGVAAGTAAASAARARGAAAGTAAGRLAAAAAADNDAFLAGADARAAQLLAHQDAQLDGMSAAVTRIGEVGLAIHDELQGQSVALDTLADDVDSTGARLAAARRKIVMVLEKASLKAQLAVVAGLVVALVVLTAIAFR